MKYVTIINNKQYEIEIDADGGIYINGELRDVDFLNLGGSLYSVITQNQSLEAVIEDEDSKIDVMMDGRLYETQVLDERALLMAQRRGGLGDGSGEVYSPMPGLIVNITIEKDEEVEQGQTVVILESMKMQNELKAPVSGIITAIHVGAGQTVVKGELLIEIEHEEEVAE